MAPIQRKSAADIEALRWREMFQAALSGFACNPPAHNSNSKDIVNAACQAADLGLQAFYTRYEREK